MPQQPPPQARPSGSALGQAAMVVGIVAIPLLFVFGLGGLAGLVAIGFGVGDFRNAARGRPSSRGKAMVGIGCGLLAMIGAVVLIARPDS